MSAGNGETPTDGQEDGQDQDQTQPGDGSEQAGSTGTAGESRQYAVNTDVFPDPDRVGQEAAEQYRHDTTMTIAGIDVPGVYEVVESGAGRKSQYLKETQAGSQTGTGIDLEDDFGGDPSNLPDNSGGGGGGEDTSSAGGEQVPPLTLKISAYVGSATYAQLDGLRTTPATEQLFDAAIGNIVLEDCELVKLTRSLSGEQPTVYDCTIKVREYREYEVIDNTSQTNYGGDTGGGGGGGGDGGNGGGGGGTTTPTGDYVTEVKEWVDRDNDGQVEGPQGESPPEVRTVENLNETLSGGEALENVLVTDTNPSITAEGDGWAVRNVGFQGPINNSSAFFHVGGNGIIENVYIQGPEETGSGGKSATPGIYVDPETHWGEIVIRFCHIRYMSDDGIYASGPANTRRHPNPGAGGKTYVERCYGEHNHGASYKLGVDGSYARDSVSVDEPHRSYWGYYEETEVVNCDFASTINAGGDAWPHQNSAHVTVRNSRFGGKSGNVTGESQGSPNLGVPENVPTSAEEAANGRYYSSPPSNVDPGA